MPAALAALAWYGWEFSSAGAAFAAIFPVVAYVGLTAGVALRHR